MLKTEPQTYGWDDLVKKGTDMWDGVRNFGARNNMKLMNKGDLAFFYHSGKKPAIVGVVEIVKEHYPDPTAEKGDWVVVDVKPVDKFDSPLLLSHIKTIKELSKMVLVNNSRLSVQPVKMQEFNLIKKMSNF